MYKVELTESYFPAVEDGVVDDYSIADVLSLAARDAGDVIALKEATADGIVRRSWTYSALQATARRLAQAFAARHRPGERIAIWAPNIPEWVIAEYAAAYAGLTIVTINPSFQAREVKFVLEQSKATALYHVRSFRGNPIGEIAARVASEYENIRTVIDIQDEDALFAGADNDLPLPMSSPLAPAQVQYTSGTTGFPKGAVLHHKGLYGNAKLVMERLGMERGDVWLNFMPMFHTGGCGLATLGTLSVRGTLIIAEQFDPHAMNRIVETEGVTHFLAVPTMITGMVEALRAVPRNMSSIKGICAGGAMVAPDLAQRAKDLLGVRPNILYGQTESSPVETMTWRDDTLSDATETVGQPLPFVELSIRDLESNRIVPLGKQGEICARSFMNMIEYNDNPKATAEALDNEGWLHTGDLGTMDARGYVRVTGRVKEMIIRGGENLFPAEIENALLEHPHIEEVAVVGITDEKFGEVVACFMRLHAEGRPTRHDLVTFCRARLSAQKTPAIWVHLTEWPLTGSGKIRKFVLREMFEQGAFEGREL